MPQHVAILADGAPCSRALENHLRKGRFLLALDGAANRLRGRPWLPQMISGDFDSLSKNARKHFEQRGVTFLATPDQDFTDLEKALLWCNAQGFRSIWIAQGLGKRLDHSLANLGFLKQFFSPQREILLFTDEERIRFSQDQTLELSGKKGRGFAVLPFPSCRVSSRGLAYEMQELKLELGARASVANKTTRAKVRLKIHGQALVIEEFQVR